MLKSFMNGPLMEDQLLFATVDKSGLNQFLLRQGQSQSLEVQGQRCTLSLALKKLFKSFMYGPFIEDQQLFATVDKKGAQPILVTTRTKMITRSTRHTISCA
jgi:hypothetical protein